MTNQNGFHIINSAIKESIVCILKPIKLGSSQAFIIPKKFIKLKNKQYVIVLQEVGTIWQL